MKTSKILRSFLALALALAAVAPTAHAQYVAPSPAPTMITSAPYTITTAGYYQLGADLFYSGNGSTNDAIITIAANNVTLDFGGHLISGSQSAATQLYGVYANEHSDLTIKNGTIGHCFIGVCLIGNGQTGSLNINQSVHDMLITNCYYSAALFLAATNSQVGTCRVSNIGGTTLSTAQVGSMTFGCSGNSIALAFTSGAGNMATNNTITNLTGTAINYGIYDDSNEVAASGNTISKLAGGGCGIYLVAYAVNNTITNSATGIREATKYANNLTSGCSTPFTGGTGVGYNN